MRYQDAVRAAGLDIWHERGSNITETGTRLAHGAISQLRAHAFGLHGDKRPVALLCRQRGLKPRVAKKWSIRLLREYLPRSARMTGPVLRSKTWRSR